MKKQHTRKGLRDVVRFEAYRKQRERQAASALLIAVDLFFGKVKA